VPGAGELNHFCGRAGCAGLGFFSGFNTYPAQVLWRTLGFWRWVLHWALIAVNPFAQENSAVYQWAAILVVGNPLGGLSSRVNSS